MSPQARMRDRQYVETGLRSLFGDGFRRVEGNWYLINERTIVRVCYSKTFSRPGYTRYFFGVQQDKYNEYKSKDIHVLFVCGDFSRAFLLPNTILDGLLEGVAVASDGNWKFDIHHRNNHFELQVTGKHLDISLFLCQPIDDAVFQPTSDPILLDERAQRLRIRGIVVRPEGNSKPAVTTVSTARVFAQLPAVKAWVLQEAKGICELCQQPGPFLLPNGERYLEIHHVKRLAHGGPDTVENAVAVCPNCHRLLHWAVDAKKAQEKLYRQIPRLIRA